MKTIIIAITAVLFCVAITLRNQTAIAQAVARKALETNYWSRAHPEWPPLPGLPATNLGFKIYFLNDAANILIDDRNFVYPTNMEEMIKSNLTARRIPAPGIKTRLYTTNAAELEAIRRLLPSFEHTLKGASDPSNLPPVLGGTNTTIKAEPLPAKDQSGPAKSIFLLPFLFRRRRFNGSTIQRFNLKNIFVGFAYFVVSLLQARADISVSSYLLQGWPLPCPGNELGHLLHNGTGTNTSYYPNQVAATFMDPTNFVTTGILHGSPAVMGGIIIPLEGSPFFSIGVSYPSGCVFHTNSWNCFEIHFLGQFPNGTNFSNTNLMVMDPDTDALIVAYVAEAIFSYPPWGLRPIFSQSGANIGLYVPTATRIGDAVQLDYELPEGFTAQVRTSPDLQTWSYATNGGGGVNYVTIPNQTNGVMFYSITTTNEYTTAP